MIDALYDFGVPFVVDADVTDEMLAYAVADAARKRKGRKASVLRLTGINVAGQAGVPLNEVIEMRFTGGIRRQSVARLTPAPTPASTAGPLQVILDLGQPESHLAFHATRRALQGFPEGEGQAWCRMSLAPREEAQEANQEEERCLQMPAQPFERAGQQV